MRSGVMVLRGGLMSQIVIISGPPGAGKSSVAEALCERYDRTVRLETDDLY